MQVVNKSIHQTLTRLQSHTPQIRDNIILQYGLYNITDHLVNSHGLQFERYWLIITKLWGGWQNNWGLTGVILSGY
jgi:hypothetical protein